ncbi:MAG TPA: SH3 beta-barrel fold-containing protein [Caldisericia bacterium]|nr:SH3 beta-barrel fold-containing protein [Caldisericia bacterium]
MFMSTLGKLLDLLKAGEVVFEYRTVKGRTRKARGTLNDKLIPKQDWAKGKLMRQPPPKTDEFSVRQRMYQPFYDLDIGEWRRFSVIRLTKIISTRPFANVLQKLKTGFKSMFTRDQEEI